MLARPKIPKTLCSNSPGRIKEFMRAMPRVLYKPFFPASWRSPQGLAVAFSSLVQEDDLPEDEILQSTPGIFQEYMEKLYEVRVTAVGNHLFAVNLRSQEVEEAKVDWRTAPDEVPMEPVSLPEGVEAACRHIMQDLGLVFGCFDLIVTPAKDYVFLEINEMGAFLWIQERFPELGLLDAFCELLIQGRMNLHWQRSADPVRYFDAARRELERYEQQSGQTHVLLPSGHTFEEPGL